MKTLKRISISTLVIYLINSRCVYATTDSSGSGIASKYIFMGIAFLVIMSLLFLGYRMDIKENTVHTKKEKKKNMKKVDTPYEQDNIKYESDNIEPVKIDNVEYEEDEDSFLEDSSDDSNILNILPQEMNSINEENTMEYTEELNEEEKSNEGEEFDISIIDGIEDEKNILTDSILEDDSLISMKKLEDEIDNLDVFDEDIKNDDNDFINSLKNFKEPESDYKDFSSVSNIQEENKSDKKVRKYTRIKNTADSFSDNKEEKVKKSTKKTSSKKKKD